MPNLVWNEERDATLRSMAAEFKTRSEMCATLDICRDTLRTRATELGLILIDDRNPVPNGTWTAERVATLTALYAQKEISTAEIGRRMGLTKNQVVAKASRLGLSRLVRLVVKKKPRFEFPQPNRCVFPIGDPGEEGFHFCGERIRGVAEPYCEAHHELCWKRPPPRPGALSDFERRRVA